MLPNTNTALVVFAREPKDGKVKTRLCGSLPAPIVTRLYKAFVKDVLEQAAAVRCDRKYVFYAGQGGSQSYLSLVASNGFELKQQKGGDLGERMLMAFDYCRGRHSTKTVIIGTDCLTLTADDIQEAFNKLDDHDCVIGPANDGGYYLIGLSVPCGKLFNGIPWGSDQALAQTVNRAQKSGLDVHLLGLQEDVDTVGQLIGLEDKLKGSGTGENTLMCLRSLNVISGIS